MNSGERSVLTTVTIWIVASLLSGDVHRGRWTGLLMAAVFATLITRPPLTTYPTNGENHEPARIQVSSRPEEEVGPVFYTEGKTKYRITATVRHDDECGNGHNSFHYG
jgi:hypothetical protein